MANPYFFWPASLRRLIRFDSARSEDVNDAFDELSSGLDVLAGDVNRSLKLPTGTADQTLALSAGQRANLVVSFDAAGNITAIQGGFAYRGDWVTDTQYVKNDVVRDAASKNLYVCLVAHTSGTLATDITAGKFGLAVNLIDVETAKAAAQAAAATATTQADIATTQAGLATTNGAAQVALATAQANLATTNGAAQVALATTQAGIATTQAGNASTSAGQAAASATAAAASYDSFDDRYLGSKAADPTVDNGGNALLVGALYWNTPAGQMRAWDGSAWIAAYLPASGYATLATAQTLTNKTIDGQSNTLLNVPPSAVPRSARTSNTAIAAADKGSFIDITSGTFTQSFVAAATLGNGWWCWLRNSGSGDITLDPNGAEQIDGLTSYVMYPGEARLVLCDGAALRSIVVRPFSRVFTVSGSFVKPPGYSNFGGLAWGAGGSGGACGSTTYAATGGGGAACVPYQLPSSVFGATETVTIASGGAAVQSGSAVAGNAGGNSSIGAVVIAYGGGAGYAGTAGNYSGGAGGGVSGAGANGLAGTSNGGAPSSSVGSFGGASGTANSGSAGSVYGGGSGGGTDGSTAGAGGTSFYGGGGGGGVWNTSKAGGTSTYGGGGGTSGTSGNATAGSAPGGGGGAAGYGYNSGAGARGEIRIFGLV